MLHLHKAIDKVSTEPEFKESVGVLTEVVRDYQQQIEKVKSALSNIQVGNNQHQEHQQGQQQGQK
ncbi:hypothetical protein [Brevibacillus migulae]|uniref:hypothetical protein n=1 Tax=Brevibacillus migulae TaxID=1644114 RepID=UPI00106E451C|nr:hypothetical protein [Brevibacillus migulae]